ncbi:alanine/glycine:cation symporter family protein [Lutispora saccharofermentans]|uniref:Sodium:alanine symporter family protein n=1 Tax=Lutispora saccharofermentans TaxID=3024236 RepID=A0ABT1NAC1_9FIRM|nr:sodium:alanine symporter family protein [Lutispora saccharofermentans]MCQ1528210.1 sodium:alanine symporter family protein [Lutispora saccharofermentans]
MDIMSILKQINGVLWGPIMLFLLLGTGILYTSKLRFPQVRRFKNIFKQAFGGIFKKEKTEGQEGGISSFQALATAIAAQVGTGNLAGVATAIASGGPGAVFWMWISAFFGMGTIFAEAVLAQTYTENIDGEVTGGPAYYIKKGLGSKFLAGFFAITIVIALGFVGNMVQSNSIGEAFNSAFGIPNLYVGIIVAILVAMIIFGGIGRIASFAEKVVPFMALLYIVGGLVIVLKNADMILPAFKMIIYGAFNPAAATGGIIGVSVKEAFRYGIARGLFSNEAGMGSTPHAHAVAKVKHPAQQGLVAIMGVIIDTLVICTFTALVVLMTGVIDTGLTGIALTQEAFARGFGAFGNPFIAICLLFFSFTTIVGWYFFGEANMKYLFGKGSLTIYRIAVLAFIVFGTTMKVPVVWELADMFNGLMVIPNLIALLGMISLVVKTFNDYESKYDKLGNLK